MTPLIALLSLLGSGLPAAGPADAVAVRGTVWVRAGDMAVGTGWVVDVGRKWVVTARHVLADRESVEVFFRDGTDTDRRHYIADRADLAKRGRTAVGRVVLKWDTADLALLALDRLPDDVPALPLARTDPRPGDGCWSVGHRHDADLLWTRTDGHVRQAGTLTDGYFWAGRRIGAGVPVVVVQSPIEAGESGAALLNPAGEVVGVVSAVSNRTPGWAIAIHVSQVRDLLADARKQDRAPAPMSPPPPEAAGRPAADAVLRASVWVRPRSTEGRAAGVLIDRDRRLVLTSAAAVGPEEVIDVVAPKWDGRLVSEAAAYQDLLGLRLSGHCVQGTVLARDIGRDLALVELDAVPDTLAAVPLGPAPKMGDRVASLSHPTGEELLWLYAAGSVRSVGRVTLRRDGAEETTKPLAALLQLPHQGSASGGPVVNEKGELVGVLSAREGTRQELAYAAAPDEIGQVLKAARPLSRPEAAAEWHARATFLTRHGRSKAALSAHREAVRLAPQDASVLAALALALAVSGEADAARKVLERATSLPDHPPAADAVLAEAYLALGDRDRALARAEAALKADPKLAAALVTRAALRSGKAAAADLDEALFLDPNGVAAYRLRAGLHDPKDPDARTKALADLTRVLELEPCDVGARSRRAGLLAEAREFKKAAADWVRLTELAPLRAGHWLGLAGAQFAAGDRPMAARALAAAVRVEPTQAPSVLKTVREYASQLQDDNPADPGRVAEWYVTALRAVGPGLPAAARRAVGQGLAEAEKEPDDRRRADRLGRLVEEAIAK